MAKSAKVILLRMEDTFALTTPTASTELFQELQAAASKIVLPQGAILFRRGEAPTGVFLVLGGSVNLELEGVGGPGAVRSHGPGSVVGLPASLSGNTYSLTAQVAEDASLGFIPRAKFLELMAKSPPLCLQVMQILSEEIGHSRTLTEALLRNGNKRGPAS